MRAVVFLPLHFIFHSKNWVHSIKTRLELITWTQMRTCIVRWNFVMFANYILIHLMKTSHMNPPQLAFIWQIIYISIGFHFKWSQSNEKCVSIKTIASILFVDYCWNCEKVSEREQSRRKVLFICSKILNENELWTRMRVMRIKCRRKIVFFSINKQIIICFKKFIYLYGVKLYGADFMEDFCYILLI